MKGRVIVVAMIEKGEMILFGRKARDIGPYPGKLHLIGGGVELGDERIEEAMVREIKEETSLDFKVSDLEKVTFMDDVEPDHKNEMTHYIILIYRVKYLGGELMPKDDLVELFWVDKKDLGSQELNRPQVGLFREMGYLK